MIYITGDTHGLKEISKLISFNEKKHFTKSDFMIIAGDFGVIWDINSINRYIDFYSKFPFTILFIDGNHENFDFLDAFPVEQWNGGKDLELNVALHPEDMGGWVKVFVWNSLNKLEPRLFRSRYLSEEAIARQ